MRIGLGGIYHESNTFIAQPMTMEKFAEKDLHYGQDIIAHWENTCSEMGGFLQGAKTFGFGIVPTLMAWGMPSGALTAPTFETLSNRLISLLQAASPLDGVLLSLHGAMVAENFPDADGEILARVRKTLGPGTPLVVTLDYHANLTEEMVHWPDALIGYDTYPHVDQAERGLEAADILQRIIRSGLRPSMALARRPFLPHILNQATERPPMADAVRRAHELERRPDILSVTIAAGFPFTDVPEAGLGVVVVNSESADKAREVAEDLSESIWRRRSAFEVRLPGLVEAVRQAMSNPAGLTILVDVGDNLGAGTPGDGTFILAEFLKRGATGALVLLPDPEAVAECLKAGVRKKVRVKVGGKTDRCHGDPIEIVGQVRMLSDGIYRNIGAMRDGVVDDQGRTAVVDTGGVLVVLTERRMPMWNLQQLRFLGIEPARLRILVVKAAIAYRAAYAPISQQIIEVDTLGLSTANVRRFNYQRLRRPIYPLDPM